jgi:DNA-binding LacI/PurR family transcriptional regulator/AraC-like DNA-binding protein
MQYAGSLGWVVDHGAYNHQYLAQNQYDGLIVAVDAHTPNWALKWSVPRVFLFQRFADNNISTDEPLLLFEEEKLGQLAAEQLLKLERRQIHLLNPHKGNPNPAFSKRRDGFIKLCRQREVDVVISEKGVLADQPLNEHLIRFFQEHLLAHPGPISVLLLQDQDAPLLYAACRALGRKIPEEVSIISINDNTALCKHLQPRLSSIDPGWRKLGEKAGELLQRAFEGQTVRGEFTVGDDGVFIRGSFSQPKSKNPIILATLKYIEDNIHKSPVVKDICTELDVSSRELSIAFQKEMNCSIKKHVTDLRVVHLKNYIKEGTAPSAQIAKRMNFSSEFYLYNYFKKHTGMTVKAFRERHGVSRPDAARTS